MYTLIVIMALVQVRKVGQLGEPTENAIISTFRVYILLFTMIAILAVDFNVFPTHFGKERADQATFIASFLKNGNENYRSRHP